MVSDELLNNLIIVVVGYFYFRQSIPTDDLVSFFFEYKELEGHLSGERLSDYRLFAVEQFVRALEKVNKHAAHCHHVDRRGSYETASEGFEGGALTEEYHLQHSEEVEGTVDIANIATVETIYPDDAFLHLSHNPLRVELIKPESIEDRIELINELQGLLNDCASAFDQVLILVPRLSRVPPDFVLRAALDNRLKLHNFGVFDAVVEVQEVQDENTIVPAHQLLHMLQIDPRIHLCFLVF